MTAFNYEVTRGDGSISIRLEGDLDMHLSPDLRRMFEEQLDPPPAEVVVDLGGVPFIDSSVIATLVYTLKKDRSAGGEMRVINCQPAVRDTFELTRLSDSFRIQ